MVDPKEMSLEQKKRVQILEWQKNVTENSDSEMKMHQPFTP